MGSYLEDELTFAMDLARQAGKLILDYANSNILVKYKGVDDPVTEADIASDKLIMDAIKNRFPEDGIITEESADDISRLTKKRVWIIDPIDGTANYKEFALSNKVSSNKYFAVHIGLAIDNHAVLGVVFAPAIDELYYAVKGRGAFKITGNNVPVQVKISDEIKDEYKMSFNNELYSSLSPRLLNCSYVQNPFGIVFGIYLLSIIEGKLDVFGYHSSRYFAGEWDVCAPQIILEEAGGFVSDTHGATLSYNNPTPRFQFGAMGQIREGIVPINISQSP